MKTYNKPQTETLLIEASNMIASSPLTLTKSGGAGKLSSKGAEDDAMTRQNHGIGSGLWEDMK